jgi:hypothetical protein
MACRRKGDTWAPVTPKQIGEALVAELAEGGCMHHLEEDPFAPQPDFRGLVDKGFAESTLEPHAPLAFTERGIEVLRKAASGNVSAG